MRLAASNHWIREANMINDSQRINNGVWKIDMVILRARAHDLLLLFFFFLLWTMHSGISKMENKGTHSPGVREYASLRQIRSSHDKYE